VTEFNVAKSGETEAQFRQFLSALVNQSVAGLSARSGVLSPSHGLAVSQTTTASASVQVSPGACVAQGSTLAGLYPMVNDTTKTLDVLSANPLGGLPRNDIVVFDYSTESIRVIVGTPAAVPTDPSVPSSAVQLARLSHAASATTVPSSAITDLRVFTGLRGAVINARTSSELPTGHVGAPAYRWDTNALYVSNTSGNFRALANVSDSKAGKRMHWGTATVTTDSNGYATVTHGAGFTPAAVVLTSSTITWRVTADNFTSTTFRVKTFNGSGAGYPLTGVTISYFCGE
jgi:hypothetical protein